MSEFKRVEHAQFSPTTCLTCGTHEGPFIDCEVDVPVLGHVYICCESEGKSGCLAQMAEKDGMATRETIIDLTDKLVAAGERVRVLEDTLNDRKVTITAERLMELMKT